MAAPNIIEFQGAGFTYPSGREAFSGIDLAIEKGGAFALIGSNGAGKTTLLKHINGLLYPSHGRVLFDGKEVNKKTAPGVRDRVGFVFQNPDDQLFLPTVAQDVAFGPMNHGLDRAEVEKRVKRALEVVDMEGYEGVHPGKLSGGEKKRVCIAGVLALEPEVLVFDEPTGGLDPRGTRDTIRFINKLREERGITVVIASHDVNVIPLLVERVAVLHKGRLLFDGSVRDAFGDRGLLSKASMVPPDVTRLALEMGCCPGKGLPLTMNEALRYFQKGG